MRSLLRLVFVLVFLSLFLWLLPAGQTPPTATLFGPETFLRGKGRPVTETWQFSTGCFQGPFLFHLRNGDADGKNRVSSAEVWLDGRLLFGPSDFSQKVSGYDIVVELKAQSVLEVRLASSPGSKLKIWIEGTPGDLFQYESITLYPTGGRYRLSNGIEMEIPEGAVSSPVSVTLRRILKEEVDPLMQSYGLTQKYFLAGYQGEPHGFLFNQPITLRLPSEPLLNGRDVPFRFRVDREHGAYCFASREQFIEADELPIAKIEQNEPEAVKSTTIPDVHIAQSPPCVPTCDSTRVLYSEEGWVIEGCTSGLSEDETDYAIIMITDPAASCLTSPLPCTCGNVFTTEEAKTDEAHTVGGYDCIVTGITGYTTFCGCAGYPTFAWELKEEHKPVITWSPEEVKIQVGERKDLEWDVVDAEGMPIRGAKVTAAIENKDVADEILFTEHTGGIIGKSCGSTRIKLTTLCDTTEYIDVTVEMSGADIVIDAPDTVVETCGTLKLSAKVYTKDGVQIVGHAVEWSTSDAALATVSPAKGADATLTSKTQKGAVEVIARACNQENRISITIEQRPDSIVISPPGGTVEVKKSLTLSAVVSDKCKNPISNATVDWRSLNESIATVGNGVVTGVSVGTATISATCGSLRAEAQVTVTSSSTASVTIEPAAPTIGIGETIHLVVKIDGSIIPGAAIFWTIRSDGYVSFDPNTQNVTGVAEGTATLTATYNGLSGTAVVTVTKEPSVVDSIEITPKTTTLVFHWRGRWGGSDKVRLTAIVRNKSGAIIEDRPITWSLNGSPATEKLTPVPNSQAVEFSYDGYAVEHASFVNATCEGKSTYAVVIIKDSRDILDAETGTAEWTFIIYLSSAPGNCCHWGWKDSALAPNFPITARGGFGLRPGWYPDNCFIAVGGPDIVRCCQNYTVSPSDFSILITHSPDPSCDLSQGLGKIYPDYGGVCFTFVGTVESSIRMSGTYTAVAIDKDHGYWDYRPDGSVIWVPNIRTCTYAGTWVAGRVPWGSY